MYSKNQIIDKINNLKECCLASGNNEVGDFIITGENKANLLIPLHEVILKYFAYDDFLKTQIMYLINQLYGDNIRRNTVYLSSDKFPQPNNDFPEGYDDITILFSVEGAIKEIMEIEFDVFLKSIEVGISGEIDSPFATKWIEKFSNARKKELAGVESILNFCKSGGFEEGLFISFADIESSNHLCDKKSIAQKIYTKKKYKELIDILGLKIYIPAYIKNASS